MTLAFRSPAFPQKMVAASTCRSINKAAERDEINHVLIKSYDKCVKKSRDCVYHPRISDKILVTSFDERTEWDWGVKRSHLDNKFIFLFFLLLHALNLLYFLLVLVHFYCFKFQQLEAINPEEVKQQ